MTKQIAVRLPDDIVEFIDRLVGEGVESSRAAVVARAVERERRRDRAARDVRILKRSAVSDDLDELAKYASTVQSDLD
ncbi:MAG: antitoxin [Kineosporiaceae bacterium]|nr:antitoxin [Aeromicrobium sp.]